MEEGLARQSCNNTSLIQFLLNVCKKQKYTDKLVGKCLYVTTLDKCWKITQGCCEEVPALSSQHEEAYGRLLLHAAHASREGFEAVVICADVIQMSSSSVSHSETTYMLHCFKSVALTTRTSLIDVSNVAASVGPEVCIALLGLHAFTGCDICRER